MSVNTAVLRYIFPRARLGRAIGWNAMVAAAGSTIGPTFAGGVLAGLSWPWLFAVNVPLGIATILVGVRSLPESDRADRPFDALGAVLAALTIGLLITSVDGLAHGLGGPVVLAQVVLGLGAGVWLTRRGLGQAAPLLPLDLLRRPIFALSVVTSVASFTAQMMAFTALPFLFEGAFGFEPVEVGFLMVPWPLAVGLAAPVAGWLSDRYPPGLLGACGMALMTAGLTALSWLAPGAGPADIAWRMALCGAGFGLFQSPQQPHADQRGPPLPLGRGQRHAGHRAPQRPGHRGGPGGPHAGARRPGRVDPGAARRDRVRGRRRLHQPVPARRVRQRDGRARPAGPWRALRVRCPMGRGCPR